MANFFKQFILKPAATGGLAPCGPRVVEMVTNATQLHQASSIVELGPGTGVFTEAILRKIPADADFFAIEINPDFVAATRKKCPGAIVYEDSAENLPKYLEAHDMKQVDVIVSTLPWTVFSTDVRDKILEEVVTALKPGGEFITVCYLHGRNLPGGVKFRKALQAHFKKVTPTKPVWNRMFPMFAYHCIT